MKTINKKSDLAIKMNRELYDHLEVSPSASADEIKKSYRRLAMIHHPDKGGSDASFKKIQHAYEILGDPEKRTMYDQFGEDLGQSAGPAFDHPFAQFFQNRGAAAPQHKVAVALSVLYKGGMQRVQLSKKVACKDCNGQGVRPNAKVTKCIHCKGEGMIRITRQIGPGMVQQMQTTCNKCSGKGQSVDKADLCAACQGSKFSVQHVSHNVTIEAGAAAGQTLHLPDGVAVVIEEIPHALFERRGNHLVMKHSITLLEALTGPRFRVTHLDGRVIEIAAPPMTVITPDAVFQIPKEGMPVMRRPQRGNLIIQFDVVFPKVITPDVAMHLSKLLPGPEPMPVGPISSSAILQPFDEHTFREREQQPQPPQCQTQ